MDPRGTERSWRVADRSREQAWVGGYPARCGHAGRRQRQVVRGVFPALSSRAVLPQQGTSECDAEVRSLAGRRLARTGAATGQQGEFVNNRIQPQSGNEL